MSRIDPSEEFLIKEESNANNFQFTYRCFFSSRHAP